MAQEAATGVGWAWFIRLRHRAAAFAHDVIMVPAAWLGAFVLLFDLGEIPGG
mgnify:FL=1